MPLEVKVTVRKLAVQQLRMDFQEKERKEQEWSLPPLETRHSVVGDLLLGQTFR